MKFSYDLIFMHKGELKTETVLVDDAAEAWRIGRERYSECIRGVVCQEGVEVMETNPS